MSSTRRPPAMQYPVSSDPALAAGLLLLGMTLACVLASWRLGWQNAPDWLGVVWAAAWAWLLLMAWRGWRWYRSLPQGWLHWTGEHWSFRPLTTGYSSRLQPAALDDSEPEQPRPQAWQCRIALDLQWGMLVRLQGVPRAPAQWLWLRNAMAPADWALLRAVLHWSQRSQPADGEAR